jgi:Ca2+-binding RTX toxin-like protein
VRISVAFRLSAALIVAVAVGAGLSGTAAAATCSYSGATLEVTATLGPGELATLAVTGPDIELNGSPCGAATNTNTDRILVSGPGGSTEHLIIDQFNGPLAPGATTPDDIEDPEIEVRVELGDASDEVVVRGSPDEVPLAAGHRGVAFNDDHDVDITFSPLPNSIELVAADGMPHILTARGGYGSGLVFPGPVTLRAGNLGDSLTGSNFGDLLVGGGGGDFIHGSGGPDVIDGGAGNDKLRGVDGDDSVSGGPGADILLGGYGDDVIDAHDGKADLNIHGGPGIDTAAYDRALDPDPIVVENRFPLDPPPPPPPGPDPVKTDCSWAGGVVSATIAPGMRATLTVTGGLIRFGAPATGCGGATTSNTDRITVEGATDTPETLVIDLRGGRLAPGATPETGQSEIEVDVNLHDVVDLIRVIGEGSGASLAVGSRGISLNRDNDVDIPIDPDPIMVSLIGGGGRDRLTAAGGFGAGGSFAGSADLHGGGSADVLVGGTGRDRMWGGKGPDVLRAVDHKRDRRLDGDAGRDTAYFDRGRDVPVDCERLRPRGG